MKKHISCGGLDPTPFYIYALEHNGCAQLALAHAARQLPYQARLLPDIHQAHENHVQLCKQEPDRSYTIIDDRAQYSLGIHITSGVCFRPLDISKMVTFLEPNTTYLFQIFWRPLSQPLKSHLIEFTTLEWDSREKWGDVFDPSHETTRTKLRSNTEPFSLHTSGAFFLDGINGYLNQGQDSFVLKFKVTYGNE